MSHGVCSVSLCSMYIGLEWKSTTYFCAVFSAISGPVSHILIYVVAFIYCFIKRSVSLIVYTVFHKKRPLFVFLIMHSNDDQITPDFYQLWLKKY